MITLCYIVDNFLLTAETVKQKPLTPHTVFMSSKNTLHAGIADQTRENGPVIDRAGKSIETLQAEENAAEQRISGNNERRQEKISGSRDKNGSKAAAGPD